MKKLAVIIVLLSVPLALKSHAQNELRTWTSQSGHQVKAVFVEKKGISVVLRKDDASLVRINLSQLSVADRAYVKKRSAPRSSGPTKGTVTFEVETKTTKKQFAPRHVLAIWVTDNKGKFVRTLQCNAKHYVRYLKKWAKNSGKNTVNAVTSASLKAHKTHKVTWDCRDASGKLVKDGMYRIRVEFSEVNGSGPSTPEDHIKFTKGPKSFSAKLKSLRNFTKMTVTHTPE